MAALTPREAEVAHLLRQGYTPKEVAHLLGVGLSTVRARIKWASHRLPGPHPPMIRVILWSVYATQEASHGTP